MTPIKITRYPPRVKRGWFTLRQGRKLVAFGGVRRMCTTLREALRRELEGV